MLSACLFIQSLIQYSSYINVLKYWIHNKYKFYDKNYPFLTDQTLPLRIYVVVNGNHKGRRIYGLIYDLDITNVWDQSNARDWSEKWDSQCQTLSQFLSGNVTKNCESKANLIWDSNQIRFNVCYLLTVITCWWESMLFKFSDKIRELRKNVRFFELRGSTQLTEDRDKDWLEK